MKLENLVHKYSDALSDLDRDIITYIMKHTCDISQMSITDLAEAVHASKSSVLRTTKRLGFSGYSEFKYYLRQTYEQDPAAEEKDIFQMQKDDILQTLAFLQSYDLMPIYRLFDQSDMIYCFATGYSQTQAISEFYKMMLTMGKRVIVIPNKTELDMAMPMIRETDCVVVASLSGETEDPKENLTIFALRNIPVVTITAPGDNYFARNSDYHLTYYADFFTIGPEQSLSQSLIGLNVLVDYVIRGYGIHTLGE